MASGRQTHDIAEALNQEVFAVVGASRSPAKFGYLVYQSLKRAGYRVYAVNPNAEEIEGDPVYPLLDNVPERIGCVVTVVHPEVAFDIVRQAGRLSVPFVWMQPGSESEPAVIEAQAQGVRAIHGGPCVMVEAAARDTTGR